MKINRNILILVAVFFTSTLLLIGCTENSGETNNNGNINNMNSNHEDNVNVENDVDPEPVTLQFVIEWEEEVFKRRFADPIKEEFPWITLEQVPYTSDREQLEEVFAGGLNPDFFKILSPEEMKYFDLEYDLDELIEKHQYDMSHLDPVIIDALRAQDPDRRLLSFPYEVMKFVLFYNKEVFDLFGEDYPSHHMTWEEALELAKGLTGERNGVYYRGLDLGPVDVPLKQFPVNQTDPETGEVLLDKPEFAQYVDLIDQIVRIDSESSEHFFNPDKFTDSQSTAMFIENVQALTWWEDIEGLNEAVAPLPVWDRENPLAHRPDSIIQLAINPESEHIDEVFKVLTFFLDTEYQKFASRNGIGPSSNEKEVLEQFFQDYESTHDKNVQSIFTHPPASLPDVISKWDDYVDLNMHEYFEMEVDRNEFLRIVTEESEAKIKNAMEAN